MKTVIKSLSATSLIFAFTLTLPVLVFAIPSNDTLRGWSGYVGWDYQKFSNNGTTFAENFPNTGFTARNYNADTSYHSGFDIGLGYNIPNKGSRINLDYAYLHSSDSTTVSGDNLVLFPELVSATSANNSLRYNYDSVDLTASHSFNPSPQFNIDVYGGVNYSHLSRKMITTGFGFGNDVVINGGFSYNGVGPTFGLDAYCSPLLQYPHFSIFGGVKPSILYGTMTSFNNFTLNGETEVDDLPDEKIVVPAVSAKLGLNYDIPYRDMSYNIQLGYSLTNYFNVGKDVNYTNSINTSFQGFFLNFGLSY